MKLLGDFKMTQKVEFYRIIRNLGLVTIPKRFREELELGIGDPIKIIGKSPGDIKL